MMQFTACCSMQNVLNYRQKHRHLHGSYAGHHLHAFAGTAGERGAQKSNQPLQRLILLVHTLSQLFMGQFCFHLRSKAKKCHDELSGQVNQHEEAIHA